MERGGTRRRAQRSSGCRLSERHRQPLERTRDALDQYLVCDGWALYRLEDVQVRTQRRSLVQIASSAADQHCFPAW